MRVCPSCGNNNADGAVFCTYCGNEFAPETETQNFNTAETQETTKPSKNERISINLPNGNDFVSKDEYVVAALTNGFADNVLSGEGFKTEGAVITNKRLYYNHRQGVINIRTQEEKIDIKDITGSKIANFNPLGLLILSILILLIGIIAALVEEDEEIFFAMLPAALVFFVAYICAKKSHLRIEYAGGAISFSVKKYGKENIRKFQKCIYAVKDSIEANKK